MSLTLSLAKVGFPDEQRAAERGGDRRLGRTGSGCARWLGDSVTASRVGLGAGSLVVGGGRLLG